VSFVLPPASSISSGLRFLFVRPCAARPPAQVTWTRGRGHPTVLGARWRSPAITPHPSTLFSLRLSLRESSSRSCEKVHSRVRWPLCREEILIPVKTPAGGSFVANEAVCSPLVNSRRWRHQSSSLVMLTGWVGGLLLDVLSGDVTQSVVVSGRHPVRMLVVLGHHPVRGSFRTSPSPHAGSLGRHPVRGSFRTSPSPHAGSFRTSPSPWYPG